MSLFSDDVAGNSTVPTEAQRMKLVAEEVAQIESALARGSVVYVLGNSRPRLVESRHGFIVSFLKDYLLAHPYEVPACLPHLCSRFKVFP